MKVIGIIGKDNKVSNKIGYLLGVGATAMHDLRKKTYSDDEAMKFDWLLRVGQIMNDPLAPNIHDLDSFAVHTNSYCGSGVSMESFAHSLQFMVSTLTSIPVNYFMDCKLKKDYVINIKTFEFRKREVGDVLMNPYDLYDRMAINASFAPGSGQEVDDCWMTLNSYVIYFGQCVCRTFLGKDIWTRVEERMTKTYPPEEDTVKIYTDVKSMSEYEYIRSIGGKIVFVEGTKAFGGCIYEESLDDVDQDLTFVVDENGDIIGNAWEKMYDLLKTVII